MRHRYVRTAVLCLCGWTAALALFELGVRLLEPQPEEPYRFAPATYFEPIPSARFVYRRQEFSIPVAFNAFGMRDRERELHKPAATLRVALLGDSYAEALQVPLDSTLSQRLEASLETCFDGFDVEVLNFGVSGFGTAASAARYTSLASRFQPDLVLYLFVGNDPWDLLQEDRRLYEFRDGVMTLRPVLLGPLKRLACAVTDRAKRHFHAYRFLKYRLLVAREGRILRAAAERGASGGSGELLPGDTAWELVGDALGLMDRAVRADGAALLVVHARSQGPDMNHRLAALCGELGLPLHSLLPALAADPGPVGFQIDGHWRARGHLVASRDLAPVVCRRLAALTGKTTP